MKKNYARLSERSVDYFLMTYSDFLPVKSDKADEEAQRAAYDFLRGLYGLLYNEPQRLWKKELPDDSYDNWEPQKDRPELAETIRKYIVTVDKLMAAVCHAVYSGSLTDGGIFLEKGACEDESELKKLKKLDVDVKATAEGTLIRLPVKTAEGLKLLAEISVEAEKEAVYKNSDYIRFSRGIFDVGEGFTKRVFARLSGDEEAFGRLIGYFEENGFVRIENRCFSNRFSKVSLDYIRYHDKEFDEIPSFFAENTHSGAEIALEEIRGESFVITLRIPYFKRLLEMAEEMSDDVRTFVCDTTKKCDGCGYCTQTDKTGKRPRAAVKVGKYMLCPLFSGFSYRKRGIDDAFADNAIGLMKFIGERM